MINQKKAIKQHELIKEVIKRGKLKSLSLGEGIGMSEEAHLAVLDGKNYLLRVCKDAETAGEYFNYYSKFENYSIFPELLGSYKNYLLFEFIDGRMCFEKESPDVIYKIGRICAIINKAGADYNYQKTGKFKIRIDNITKNKVMPFDMIKKAEETYLRLSKKVRLKSSLDIGDVTNDNFMVDKRGKVYFVDIEAVKPNIKGYGVVKAFSLWFKTDMERKLFRKGYRSAISMKYFNKDYENLTTLIFLVHRVNYKFFKGHDNYVKATIKKLRAFFERL